MIRRLPFLCRFAHRWRPMDDIGGNGTAYEQCKRCGMFRSSMAAWDGAIYGDPFWTDPRPN